jgi:predicted DNA-binding protein (MmcQ/YjbR family)
MNVEQIRDYCLQKENVTESFPFGGDTLVFKSSDKIFLLMSIDAEELQFNIKCNPEKL